MKFAVIDVVKVTFYQWICMEFGVAKKQYKNMSEKSKEYLIAEYQKYLRED